MEGLWSPLLGMTLPYSNLAQKAEQDRLGLQKERGGPAVN